MRPIVLIFAIAATLALVVAAHAQLWLMSPANQGGLGKPLPPPSCTADGKTDWSNACDLPMGIMLGVL